jgi:hypothetical protein
MQTMPLPRDYYPKHIADQLNVLAGIVKTRSRASLNDASHVLETISARFFNALFGWELVNLNVVQANYPAADLCDRGRRIAIQITNQEGGEKISHTAAKADEHNLGADFDRLIVFFLLPKKPGFPKRFSKPPRCPPVETWDLADLLTLMQEFDDLDTLARAAKIVDEEIGKQGAPTLERKFDIERIVKYGPAELIGRDDELKLLHDAWDKVQKKDNSRPRVLTFVALGGEGKTSLVATWAAELAERNWPECDSAFAWSFYRQGTRDQVAASSDLFLKEALAFFGDEQDRVFAASPAGAHEKGQRLARVVGQRRSLLILDGLEPLQCAPTSPTRGELKDQGIAALLKGLAQNNHGLCVVTTRYAIPDLRAFHGKTVREEKLTRLSREAGAALLKKLGVRGTTAEYAQLVEDVRGHALTLNLLGSYLRDAHGGDIRQRDLVKLAEADAEEQGGHAFGVMDAYVKSFESEGEKGQRALAILRLLGLFDRRATAGCLSALLQPPAIPDLTEPLIGFTEAQINVVLARLEDAHLITKTSDDLALRHSPSVIRHSLDAHPLLREYFARHLREGQPEGWRAAHRRLFEHLCANTHEGDAPTLEDLQPLYQAVAHGCQAGLQQAALDNVYRSRIARGNEFYAISKLGAYGSELGCAACFFESPWNLVSPVLSDGDRAFVMYGAAFCLRALGRLLEAVEPQRRALELVVARSDWERAAMYGGNLGEMELTLGEVARAVRDTAESVIYADRSGNVTRSMMDRTTHAEALHQAGRRADAELRFIEVEELKRKNPSDDSVLFSTQSFRYCDLLLTTAEHAAWRICLERPNSESILDTGTRTGLRAPRGGGQGSGHDRAAASEPVDLSPSQLDSHSREGKVEDESLRDSNPLPAVEKPLELCRDVNERASLMLKEAERRHVSLRTIGLDHLSLGRAAFYRAVLERSALSTPHPEIDSAVIGLRRAGQQDLLPFALLTRAWLRFLAGARTGPESAQADLDEAWEIAERGPMKLHMADIHLYRARLFGSPIFRAQIPQYPWESPAADLGAAEKLINACGYHRRDEELADAKVAILGVGAAG